MREPILFDTAIAVSLVMAYRCVELPNWLQMPLEFLGKHSMNIFLFHTFIYYYWFREWIYAPRNPLVIFVMLLAICCVVSVVLEWVKNWVGIKNLMK